MYKILVINPGSTSTKIAWYWDEAEKVSVNIHHPVEELAQYSSIADQFELRYKALKSCMTQHGIETSSIDAVVARGGLLKPIPSGTYLIEQPMLDDLTAGTYGEHASNLGAILAHELSQECQRPAYIVDPVVVDEMDDVARLSGHPLLPRKSIFHALNHKAVARKAAQKMGKKYQEMNLIIAHMGGGISIAAHRNGKVIDVNNALDGEGPYTPERSGGLPSGDLMRLCFSGRYSQAEIGKMIKGRGGLVAYLESNDVQQIEKRIASGNDFAELVLKGMAYQVSKTIASYGAVLNGQVDAVILTGGVAYSELVTQWIRDRVEFLAPVLIFPGGFEMDALALGALRVLRNEEQAKKY